MMAVPVDHSYDLAPHPPVPTAARLVLVDNYDSFTWNVYQYLVLEGAAVTVVRNDALTLEELDSLAPTQLVISPGPGHPDIDADVGISKLAIRHFAGRIPILGICMGEQCMYSVFGGTVAGTGAVVHGKTSPLAHDGQGVFEGLPQDIAVTRYHSLAGTQVSLPDCLEVTAWTGNQYGPDSIIMGVRHKTLTVEGVQFHPESILTEGGRLMIRNFLRVRGGTWNQSPAD